MLAALLVVKQFRFVGHSMHSIVLHACAFKQWHMCLFEFGRSTAVILQVIRSSSHVHEPQVPALCVLQP